MNKYIVNNIHDRQHYKIYESLAREAFFDLDSSQHGWSDFSQIEIGDLVYVINLNGKIVLGYKVTNIEKEVLLEEDPDLGHIYKSSGGGSTNVLFGEAVERVDQEYSSFVKSNNITNPKLNPKTGKMLKGFNCAAFD